MDNNQEMDTLVDLCGDYRLIVGNAKKERANKLNYICKNISRNLTTINRKYKKFLKTDIGEFINMFNSIKSEATGGDFQTEKVRIDSERVRRVQDRVVDLKEKIKIEIK